jgi:DNA-binding response OmpR family regulator
VIVATGPVAPLPVPPAVPVPVVPPVPEADPSPPPPQATSALASSDRRHNRIDVVIMFSPILRCHAIPFRARIELQKCHAQDGDAGLRKVFNSTHVEHPLRRDLAHAMKALLVEDEARIADFVCAGLAEHGIAVETCGDGNAGYERAVTGSFDVILLDIMLPGRDGLSILTGLRAAGVGTPVILLTARNELGDRVEGLNLGADDYIAKPFFVEELAARIHALLRRLSGDRNSRLQVGNLVLDRLDRQVTCMGHTIELTTREFSLLEYLMRSAGRVLTRKQILEHVWGYDFDPSTNLVDVCIQRIRRKIAFIDPAGDAGSPIESVRGVGYRFRQAP